VTRKANDIKDKVDAGDFSSVHKLTVEGYLNNWLNLHKDGISKTTEQGYRIYIENHVTPVLGKVLLSDLKPLQIEAFYKKELKKYSAKTVLQIHRILHKAFKVAVKNGVMGKNVCDLVDAPTPKTYNIAVYDEEKFNKLLDKIEGTRFEIPVLLAGMCGLRRGEVLGLRWSDINFENKTISVEQTAVVADRQIIFKTPKSNSSSRTFMIPDVIIPVLEKYRGIGLVCTDSKGNPVNGGTFSKRFAEMLKENKLEHLRFHDLRHFNATMMLKYGISDTEAANRLGHSDPSITRKIYQHVLSEMDKTAASKLNSIYKTKHRTGVNSGVT
jgi:integrase